MSQAGALLHQQTGGWLPQRTSSSAEKGEVRAGVSLTYTFHLLGPPKSFLTILADPLTSPFLPQAQVELGGDWARGQLK